MRQPIQILLIAVAVVAATGGFLSYRMLEPANAPLIANTAPRNLDGEPLIGQPRPDYTLGSADGNFVSAADFDGRVVLVNFWATWCAPCREEMPMLMELSQSYREQGLEVVGIALDDVQPARDFAAELGVEYAILVGSTDVMATMNLYGNIAGTLPYSVLLDRGGLIRWTKFGVLERAGVESRIRSLLDES